MARYRVVKPSFINNVYHDAGPEDECEYDGEVADNLELIKPRKPHHHSPEHEEESLA